MPKAEPTHRQILRVLKETDGGYVSGTALASQLGLSRAAVWKHVRNLKAMGYEIQSHPKEGYRLMAAPNSLIEEEILPNLTTSWLARAYHFHASTGSTNDLALELAAKGSPHGTVILAEEQTKGRGRLRRPWMSSPGQGIYMSMILRTPLTIQEASQTTSIAALTLVKLLRERYSMAAAIKWPNDVLVSGKKISGILTEMHSEQDHARFIVIGIGINVNHGREELAGPFRYPATSIAVELGAPVDRQEFLLAFLHGFELEYERFLKEGFAALLPQLEAFSAIIGKHITVHRGKDETSGRAVGFTPEGALLLQTDEGVQEAVWVGDVSRVEGAV